uniref:G-protein coupled receptors family 1 profile domain-containing protein n=2 Tax=Oreochromis TaxID=8139 RepID=I3KI12_ORENI
MKTIDRAELCFSQLNSSCRKTMHPRSLSVLFYVILSSISVLTVALNLLVIISISHFKQLHTPTNLLLFSLAVSDCFVGLLTVFQILVIDGCWYLGEQLCILYYIFDYVVTNASIGTMVLISVDRYVAICDPLYYPSKVTLKRVRTSVSLCWIFSLFCVFVLLKDNLGQPGSYNSCSGECVVLVYYVTGIVDILLSFIGPVIVIIALYLKVFMVVVTQARSMRSRIEAVAVQGSVTVTIKKSEIKAARVLGIVVVVFLACLLPYFCIGLTGDKTLLNASTATVFITLFYFNSCVNPLVYAFFYPWFRRTIKLIVTLKILNSRSCKANLLIS